MFRGSMNAHAGCLKAKQTPESKLKSGSSIQQPSERTSFCAWSLQVPIALVSLVDTPVQWFKSAQGLGTVDRTPRNTSFCAWWVAQASLEDVQQLRSQFLPQLQLQLQRLLGYCCS